MIATAWDNVPVSNELPQPSLLERLDLERSQLAEKIEKLKMFMTTNPEFQELNWHHRRLLESQLDHMSKYEGNLVERMILLNQKEEEND